MIDEDEVAQGLLAMLQCDGGPEHERDARVSKFTGTLGESAAADIAREGLAHPSTRVFDRVAATVLKHVVVSKLTSHDGEDFSWLSNISQNLADDRISWRSRMRVSADVAWAVRVTRASSLDSLVAGEIDHLATSLEDPRESGFALLVMAHLARFDYRFDAVGATVERMRMVASHCGPDYELIVEAFDCFALAGGSEGAGQDERSEDFVRELISQIHDPSRQDLLDEKMVSLVLHSLWFQNSFSASRDMVTLADWLISRDSFDWVSYYRRATGHRRLEDFDAAMIDIDRAGEYCGSANLEMTSLIHRERADIFRQRETLAGAKLLVQRSREELEGAMGGFEAQIKARLDQVSIETEVRLKEVDSRVASLTFSVLEVLALFTTLIGLVGTVLLGGFTGDLLWWHRVLIVLSGTVGMVTFLVAVHLIVRAASSPQRVPIGE